MANKNIKANALLNAIRSGLAVIFPLITYPYILRVLGAENTGKVAYAASLVSYFALLASLGISTYGVREGAKIRNNRQELNRFLSQVYTINLLSMLVSYGCMICFIFAVPKVQGYSVLLLIQSISLLTTTLGVDWINTIFEDYLYITIRSIASYLIGIGLVFLLVRSRNDYVQYAIVQILPAVFVCVLNRIYCRKYVHLRITRRMEFKKHIKPILIFFANYVAVQVYVNIDTTMIGWMQGAYYVGIYTIAVKIYTVLKNLMAAVYAVAIPRLSLYVGEGRNEEYKKLMTSLFSMIILLLLPICSGIIVLAKEIVFLFGGAGYEESVLPLQILGISLLFAIFGGIATICLNVTLGRERENLIATMISALLNFGLNLYFVPAYGPTGAAITTAISEAFVFVFCIVRLPEKTKYLDFSKILRSFLHGVFGFIIVYLADYLVGRFTLNTFLEILLVVIFSIVLYSILLWILKDEQFVATMQEIRNKRSKH